MARSSRVAVAGGGPTGLLLSLFLRQRGFFVSVFERRPDPRVSPHDDGRSINLALAERGIHALRCAGALSLLEPALLPMRGRMIHVAGKQELQLYGRNPHEVIYSVSRRRLNELLLSAAECAGIEIHFDCTVHARWPEGRSRPAHIEYETGGACREITARPLFAADGAGSHVRDAMAAAQWSRVHSERLSHGYKEIVIAAPSSGAPALAVDALHIWPRGGFMLIALPNLDGSFTATLFLEQKRLHALRTGAKVEAFWREHFAELLPLIPDVAQQFLEHPAGELGTVHTNGWHAAGEVLLIGDAAHGIVPFHGQGMNACFEDCVRLDAAIEQHADWQPRFSAFERDRKPDTDAIARMALENYREMREQVADARYRLQREIAGRLTDLFHAQFVPRYAMVTFSHSIGYAEAERRGAIQQEILDELTSDMPAATGEPATASALSAIDWSRARDLIETRLPKLKHAPA